MEGLRLILGDGTVIENGRAGLADGFLWLRFPDSTMQETAMIVFDTEKTQRIVFQFGEMSDEYIGYTICKSIMADNDRISACMVKE